MTRLREGAVGALIFLALALPLSAANDANDFYIALLHRGIGHVDAGQYETAERELRIAAFGLVDSIPNFETAQVYLAIVGDRTKNEADARRAAQRIIAADRIERRFGSLSLPAKVRADFDQIALKLLTSDQYAFLKGSPSAEPGAPAMTPQNSSAPARIPPQPVPIPKPPPAVVPAPTPVPQPRTQPSSPPKPTPSPAPVFNVNTQMAIADTALEHNDLATARKIYDQVLAQA